MKRNLKSYPLAAITKMITELDIEPYRSQQIYQWLWQKDAKDFTVMSNLSKKLRKLLSDEFVISGLNIEKKDNILKCIQSQDWKTKIEEVITQ